MKVEPSNNSSSNTKIMEKEIKKELNSGLFENEFHSAVAKRVLDLVNYRDQKSSNGDDNGPKIKTDPGCNDPGSTFDPGIEFDDSLFMCSCNQQCLDDFDDVDQHILNLRDKSKDVKEHAIMTAMLPCFTTGPKNPYTFIYKGKTICKEAFRYVFDVESFTLKALIKHMKKKGNVPRSHGNTCRRPVNTLKYEEVQYCVDFVKKQGKQYGKPVETSFRTKTGETPMYLPSTFTKKDMHKEYTDECQALSRRVAGITTFKNIWRRCCPHIRIAIMDDNDDDADQKRAAIKKKRKLSVSDDDSKGAGAVKKKRKLSIPDSTKKGVKTEKSQDSVTVKTEKLSSVKHEDLSQVQKELPLITVKSEPLELEKSEDLFTFKSEESSFMGVKVKNEQNFD